MMFLAFWKYYRDFSGYNLLAGTGAFSLMLYFKNMVNLSGVTGKTEQSFLTVLPDAFTAYCIVGFIAAIIAFEVLNRKELYFYFNLSLSRRKLLTISFTVNLILFIIISTVIYNFYA